MIEHAGSRSHLQKIAATPFNHTRKYRPSRIDMGHNMNVPAGLLLSIAGRGGQIRLTKTDASIGANQINGAQMLLGLGYQVSYVRFIRNITGNRQTLDSIRCLSRIFLYQVSNNDSGSCFSKTYR